MKKKNLIILIVLAVLVATLAIIYFNDIRKEKQITELRNFAVEDTASIDKIFLANMQNEHILLERNGNSWIANGIYPVRQDFLNILLQTIKKVDVKERVTETQKEKVLKDIASIGTKVEIYQNNKLEKTYYVGTDAQASSGTYMILEGSNIPFIVYIPGFNGYLSIRYIPEINEWRERVAFRYEPKNIKKITIEHNNAPEDSFIIHNYGNNKYGLTDLNENEVDFPIDTLAIKEYILKIKFIGFEAYLDDEIRQHKLDSVINEPFITSYTIEDINGKQKQLKTYIRQNIGGLLDDQGEPYEWDIENLYGIIDDEEIVIMQYYIVDPINNKRDYFIARN